MILVVNSRPLPKFVENARARVHSFFQCLPISPFPSANPFFPPSGPITGSFIDLTSKAYP